MPARPKIYQHVCLDKPITLGDNERLVGKHIISGGSGSYGRFLFTEEEPCIRVEGNNVTVAHCIVEGGWAGMEVYC